MGNITISGQDWVRGDEEPIAGTSSVTLRSWEQAAIESRSRFLSEMQGMGLPDHLIRQGLKVRDDGRSEVDEAIAAFWKYHPRRYIDTPPDVTNEVRQVYDSASRSAWSRLRDWWAGRVTEVESKEPLNLRLVLFFLSAPSGECTAEFTTEGTATTNLGWSVDIAGTGLGHEGQIEVTTSAGFEAINGQRKLVFVPVSVVLESVVLSEPGSLPVRYWRIDVGGLQDQHPAPGVLLLTSDTVSPMGPLLQTYPLAGDTSASKATYSYKYTQTCAANLKIGVKVGKVELGMTAKSTMKSSVELKFKLSSGKDYHLHSARDSDGVVWA